MDFKNNKKIKYKKIKGFSLIEMIIAVAIFSLVVVAVMASYVSIFKANRSLTNVQINVENAQAGMNLMAKSIRMSSIVSCVPASCSGDVTSLRVYDFSQQKCIEYKIDAGAVSSHSLVYAEKNVTDPEAWTTECTPSAALSSEAHIIDGIVNGGAFSVTQLSDTAAGKVTTALDLCSSENCAGLNNQKTEVQTTTSLLNMQESSP